MASIVNFQTKWHLIFHTSLWCDGLFCWIDWVECLKVMQMAGKLISIFLIFTYNKGKVFLIFPIFTCNQGKVSWFYLLPGGVHVSLVSIGSSPPPRNLHIAGIVQYSINLTFRSHTFLTEPLYFCNLKNFISNHL